jgi:hypothetical protein
VADACEDRVVDADGHRRPSTATGERRADLQQDYGCGKASF